MIVVIEQYNAHEYPHLMDQMFQMRARVFHDRLRWNVRVVDGRERDKYDDESPVYVIYTDDRKREVKGSLRLLPTTGPTLLADIFSDTLPAGVHLSAPTIWECTRFCLDDRSLASGLGHQLLLDSTTLIAGSFEVAMRAGIETIIGNFDSSMLRLYRQLGCEVEVLGSTLRYGGAIYLGSHRLSGSIVNKLKRRLDNLRSTIVRSSERRILAA
jgi:N-acyl-L-homoserine lactone synthetase